MFITDSRRSRRTSAYLISASLIPLLATTHVHAEPVQENSADDIVVDVAEATGTPTAVDLQSAGSINVSVESVIGTAVQGDYAPIIRLNAGTGITGTFGSITGTGEGDIQALIAYSAHGDIDISADTITLDGASTGGMIAIADDGDVTLEAGSVELNGTGIDPSYSYFPDGVVAVSNNGSANVIVGTSITHGLYGSAAAAVGTTSADVTIEHGVAYSDGSVAVLARADGDATVDAGTVEHFGAGNAVEAFSSSDDATVNVNTATSAGLGVLVLAENGTGSINYGSVEATRSAIVVNNTLDAFVSGGEGSIAFSENNYGILVQVTGDATVDVAGSVSTAGDLGSAVRVIAPGDISVAVAEVSATGPGGEPGADAQGMRIPQGGVIVEGQDGAISVDLGNVDVEGQYRYGVYAAGNGPISVSVDAVSNTSDDSAAVRIKGGAGDVDVTTGTVVATGDSGMGVVAETTSGNISVNADVTRVEGTGFVGNFTGDAVVAIAQTGNVSIISADAASAALYGSAIIGIGANVVIDSAFAETTGNGGVAVYGSANTQGGTVDLDSGSIVTTGTDTRALLANAINGIARVHVGDISTNTESNTAYGALVRGSDVELTVDGTVETGGAALGVHSLGGMATVQLNGTVMSQDIGLSAFGQIADITIAEGASIDAVRAGVALTNLSPVDSGFMYVENHGSISGSVGVYVNPNPQGIAPNVVIFNDGTLAGTTTGYSVITGSGGDVLELTENSIVEGVADLGGGYDILSLGFNEEADADAVGHVAATENVEHLSLSDGSWIADTGNSVYESIAIDEGGTLTIAQDNSFVTIVAPMVELNGRLNLLLTEDSEPGELSGITIEGDGSLHLTGPATLLVDDAAGLQYTGGTFVEDGTLLLTDVYGGDITTSGNGVFQLGDGGTLGDYTGNLVNDGTFVFARSDDYTMLGDFTGTGQFDKYGDGTIYFEGLYGFTGTTNVYAGTIGLTGTLDPETVLDLSDGAAFDLSQVSSGMASISSLAGSGGSLVLGDTVLTVAQDENTAFLGSITGSGTLVKSGTGDLKLEGDSPDFTGDAQVDEGILSVNGNYSNAEFIVNDGGTLGGNGTVGGTLVDGGTLAAGNSIGTLTVAGDLVLTSASTLQVEVNAAGDADLIDVTGMATLGNAAVEVLAQAGVYAPETSYTILSAAGGLEGAFGSVTSNFAFLDPSLVYSATDVTLTLTRNDVDYSTYAATPNQAAIGNLIEGLGYGSTLYDATLVLDRGNVAAAFETLTGEVYPAFGAALIESSELIRRDISAAMMNGGEGVSIWGSAIQQSVKGDGGQAFRDIKLNGTGLMAGIGFGAGGLHAAIGGGKVWHDPKDSQLTDSSVGMLVGQVGYGIGEGINAKAGIQYGWFDGDVTRTTSLGTVTATEIGKPAGTIAQYYAEAGFTAMVGGTFSIEPFAGIRNVDLSFDNVTESGGATALAITELDRNVTFLDLGVRAASHAIGTVAPYGSLNWRRAWGDRASTATVAFAGNTSGLGISALPISRSAIQGGLGIAYRGERFTASLGYEGSFSETFDAHGATASISLTF